MTLAGGAGRIVSISKTLCKDFVMASFPSTYLGTSRSLAVDIKMQLRFSRVFWTNADHAAFVTCSMFLFWQVVSDCVQPIPAAPSGNHHRLWMAASLMGCVDMLHNIGTVYASISHPTVGFGLTSGSPMKRIMALNQEKGDLTITTSASMTCLGVNLVLFSSNSKRHISWVSHAENWGVVPWA